MPSEQFAIQIITTGGAQTSREAAKASAALRGVQTQAGRTGAAGQTMGSRFAKGAQLAAGRAQAVGVAVRRMAVPVAAAGVATGALAVDFDDSMQKIRNLVGASERQVDRWSGRLLELGPKLGKSPRELADGLYFVTSSGIDASKAMGVLRQAAKASALDMGETETVADALTSALNAYAGTGLKAADATDVLLKTVKFGKLEADALSQSIGRVLPVSSKLGVEFDDVGASLGVMSLQGLDAAEATTALRAIFSSFLKPTADSEKALKAVGLSAEEMRRSLDEKGTLATLQLLSDRLKGNVEETARVFPNIRALVGAFNLTGGNAKQTADIFKALEADTDDVAKAFHNLQETPGQRIRRLLVTLEAQGIKLGDALLSKVVPAVEDVAEVLGDSDLSVDEKLARLAEMGGDALSDLIPAALDVGVKAAEALGTGFVRAFTDANPLEKVLLAGAAIRLIGGPGALTATGRLIGGHIGTGIATGAATTAAAGAAGGAAAGAAGGGVIGALRSKVLPVAKRVGLIGVGVVLADQVIGEFGDSAKEASSEWREALEGISDVTFFEGFKSDIAGLELFGPGDDPEQEVADKAQALMDRLTQIFESGEKIDLSEAIELRGVAREVGVAGDAYGQLVDQLNSVTRKAPDTTRALGSIIKTLRQDKLDWPAMNDIIQRLQDLPPEGRKSTAQMVLGMVGELRSKGQISAREARTFTGLIRAQIDGMENSGIKSGRRLMRELGLSFKQVEKIVSGRTAGALEATATALSVFGASGAARVKAEAARLRSIKSGDDIHHGLQTGGTIVPGQAPGDRHILSLNGLPIAKVESGEKIAVVNREAAKREMALNAMYPRGLQSGGMVDPAGPGTGVVNAAIARVVGAWSKKYDAAINYGYDPGGGHVSPGHNVTGTATDTGPAGGWAGAALALFERGLRAIEGKVPQILYGTAGIGIPWPNHGRGNHAHIEWGMNPDLAGIAAGIRLLERIRVSGPQGAIRDTAQGALDATVKAGNQMLRRAERKSLREGAERGSGGIPSGPGQVLGASVYGFGEPGTGTVGASGVSLPGKMAFAELGMGNALGHLAFGHKLNLSVGNRSVVAEKLDIGLGGGAVQGHPRVIDLWRDTAEALGLSGTWTGLVKAQGLMDGGLVQNIPGFQRGGIPGEITKVKNRIEQIRQTLREQKLTNKEQERLRKLKELLDKKGLNPERRRELQAELRALQAQRGEISPERRQELERRQEQLERDLEDLREKLRRRREKRAKRISRKGLHPELAEKLGEAERKIEFFSEQADVAERLAGLRGSESGEDLSAGEVAHIIGLLGEGAPIGKLDWQYRRRDLAARQGALAGERLAAIDDELRKDSRAKPKDRMPKWRREALRENRKNLRALVTSAGEVVIEEQGFTGEGGFIFDTQMTIADLTGREPTGTQESDRDRELREIAEAQLAESRAREHLVGSQYAVFEQFFANLPRAHRGMVIPGSPNTEVPVMARGQEAILTPEQRAAGGTYLLVEADAAALGVTVREISRADYDERSRRAGIKGRRAMHGAPTIGRKAVPR